MWNYSQSFGLKLHKTFSWIPDVSWLVGKKEMGFRNMVTIRSPKCVMSFWVLLSHPNAIVTDDSKLYSVFIFILTRANWDIYNLGLKAVCDPQKQSQTSLWKVSDINNRYFGWHSACVCVSSETDLWRKCYVTLWPLTWARAWAR